MKTKRALLAVSITTLIVVIILISLEAYYVTVALIAGILIMGHREIWSLLTKRKLPPIDERVKENTGKAIRNGFIFLASALAFLLLPFSAGITDTPDIVDVLAGLFLAGGTAYLLSYLYYDRVGPGLNEKWLKMLKRFLLVTGISLGTFIISVFLHNAIYGLFVHWFGTDFWGKIGVSDEPVFFWIALLSIVAFAVGLIGSLVIYIKGLLSRSA